MSEDEAEGGAPDPAPAPEPQGERRAERGIDGVLELRRRLLAFGFGLVALSILALLIAIYAQFLDPLLWAGSLAVLFYPLHRRILIALRGRPSAAALISTALMAALVLVPAGVLLIRLIGEVRNLWPGLQQAVRPESLARVSAWLETSPIRGVLTLFTSGSTPDTAGIESQLQQTVAWLQDWLLNRIKIITRGVPGALYQGAVTLLGFYFFLKHGPGWLGQAETVLPLQREHARRLLQIAGTTISAVFRGVILTAATQAFLAGVGFTVAGAPFPVLLTLITFVAALIPFVGPVAIWLPTAIGLYLSGDPAAGIGLGLWGLLVVSLIDNVLRPYLIGRDTSLPVFWLFLSMLGGLKFLGFLGVIVGPAALALAIACIRIYREAGWGPSRGAAGEEHRPLRADGTPW
ncbi:MAG: AI-2E family transporter [Candidatus Eisenbacteria bacterium]|nr:AI-2E family transporter [Candidatus Eisenbacteria bacterium]MCC7142965.1 AI-2E family transporter [Candidatus Eisenbacteria bacterium]